MSEFVEDDSLMGPGARLRIARESARLGAADVARYLHLKPDVIQDIENDDYSRAPRAVFLRGYIRSYAKLLNLNADELVQSLDQFYQEDDTNDAPVKTHQVMTHDKRVWLRWVSAGVSFVLMIAVAMWWHWQKNVTTQNVPIPLVAKEPKAVSTAQTDTPPQQIVEAKPEPEPEPPHIHVKLKHQMVQNNVKDQPES